MIVSRYGCCFGSLSGFGDNEALVAKATDSVAVLKSKISSLTTGLSNANRELAHCGEAGQVVIAILTAGVTATECVLRWQGQVQWFKDRLAEAKSLLNLALAAPVDAPAPLPGTEYPTGGGGLPSTSKYTNSIASTGGGEGIMDLAVLGIPLVVAIPVVLALGVGGYMMLKPKRAAPVAGYRLRRARR